MSLFDLFKKGKTSREKRVKKKRTPLFTNIVPFKTKSLKEQKIITEREEWNRIDGLAKELTDNFSRAATAASIDRDICWYIFHFRVMQMMVFEMSYICFRQYTKSVLKQILRNHKKLLLTFKEWRNSEEENLVENKKKDNEKTLH